MKNQIKKVLSVVLVFAMCLSSFVIGVSAEDCVHNGQGDTQTYHGYQDPTCTQMGGDMYTCTVCGEDYALNTVAPLGHDITEWVTVEVTCTTDGYVYGICTRENCPVEDKKVIKEGSLVAHVGHQWEITDGTCETKVCTVCGETADSDESHDWWIADEATVKAPTCAEPGEMTYKCRDCEVTKTVVIKKLDHEYEFVAKDAPQDCEDTGVEEHYKCKHCEGLFVLDSTTSTYKPVKAEDLVIEADHLGKAANGDSTVENCVQTNYWYCSVCKEEWTTTEAAHTEITKETAPTCTTWGYIYHICEVCGVETGKTEPLAPTGHSFQEKTGETEDGQPIFAVKSDAVALGTIAADCLNPGYIIYGCTNAGCKVSEEHTLADTTKVTGVKVIDPENNEALGHQWKETTAQVDATCGATGTTAIDTCERCNITRGGVDIPALTHNYVEKHYDVTCKHDGYDCLKCTNCGDEKDVKNIVTADGTAHNYIEVLVRDETKPICEDAGYTVKVCEYCGDEDADKVYHTAAGHKWDEGFVAVPGNCTDAAIITKTCTVCGQQKNFAGAKADPKEAQSHLDYLGDAGFAALTPIKTVRPASCTAPAYYAYKCTCGETFTVQGEWGHVLVDKTETDVTDCHTGKIGYTGKWCTACEKWVGAAEGGVDKVAIEHVLDSTMAKQEFVCDKTNPVAGWEAFDYCSICAAKYEVTDATTGAVTNAYLDALKEANKIYHEYTKVEAQAPTCGVAGWNEYCSVCQKATDTGIAITAFEHDYTTVVRDEETGVWGSYTETAADCDEISYKYHICKNCGDEYIDTYKKAVGHDWVEGATHDATCTEDGWVDYSCSQCTETKKDYTDELKAKGHFNGTEYFTSACTDPATNRVCEICGPIAKEHSYTDRTYSAPTCFEYGYFISICDYCGEKATVKPTEEEIATGLYAFEKLTHLKSEFRGYKDNIAPTATTGAVELWYCATCETVVEYEVSALGLATMDITADSGILAGANIVNGGLVEFTVKLDVADLDAAVLKAEFIYMAEHLEFVSAEVENIFDVKDEAGETVIATTVNKGVEIVSGLGHLTIIVDASYTANKIPTDVKLDGEFVFATLTFRVSEKMYEDDGDAVVCGLMGAVTSIANVAGKEFIEEDAIAVERVEFAVNKLGSVNADKAINAIDYLAIRQMAITNMNGTVEDGEYALDGVEVNYLAEADIDMDGDIDMDDYVLLVNYLVAPTGTYEKMVLTSQTVVTE